MDHIVYVTRSSAELKELLSGERRAIVRGSLGKRAPYGKVKAGDMLFFTTGNGTSRVKATAVVSKVYDSPKLTPEENESILDDHDEKLQLTETEKEKLSKKRYLTLIEVADVNPVVPFTVTAYGSGEDDDWESFDNIDSVIQ
ncbi:hypothetical protein [Methanocella arvoryzae]|uniref:ASCH domain-containing protein n=1 Tax=Methanocella arvoryzae (strain DSM 22066 / NBRC 105507 / MRE50) TaxID=351160 RepID=Q0W7Q4_METAR|nr:hypothetical protein [Methanocella arvoryzae]CAJ35589.1 hypothetical protein RCIX84 [Methanocella arvoryzae MRE50]